MTEQAAPATPKEPKRGVGTVIKEALRAGDSNEEALAKAKAEFPESKVTVASVSWYRNNLRKTESGVPSARDINKARKAETPAAPAADPLA